MSASAMLVVDSDVLIDALRRSGPAPARFRLALEAGRLVTTAISVFELRSGAAGRPEAKKVEALLAALPALPFDAVAARAAAELRRELEAAGRGIGMAEYQIAGICVSRRLPLLTRNLAHFERVPGLALENLPALE